MAKTREIGARALDPHDRDRVWGHDRKRYLAARQIVNRRPTPKPMFALSVRLGIAGKGGGELADPNTTNVRLVATLNVWQRPEMRATVRFAVADDGHLLYRRKKSVSRLIENYAEVHAAICELLQSI